MKKTKCTLIKCRNNTDGFCCCTNKIVKGKMIYCRCDIECLSIIEDIEEQFKENPEKALDQFLMK